MFSVEENSATGTSVGTPVTGLDADGDDLTYTLKGASEFTIDPDTAQIEVAGGANLDYESEPISYRVKVLVSDGLDENGDSDDSADDYVMVTINVTDVDEPPLAPDAPALIPNADSPKTALDVSWEAPDNTGRPEITDYDLRYRAAGATAWTSHAVTGTTTSATLAGLESLTTYQAQVRATNDEGTGDWSDIGRGRTEGDLTYNSPPEIDGDKSYTYTVNENSSAGTLVGSPIPATDADGDTLYYTLSGASEFVIDLTTGQIAVSDDADLDYEVKRLYRVKVSVSDRLNAKGGSDPSVDDFTTVFVRVLDVDEPPAAPAAPTLTPDENTPTSVLIAEWEAPANTGPAITGYNLRYRAQGADGWTSQSVVGTTTTATLSGLDSDTAYEAQVRATNAEGTGAWSNSGSGSTAEPNAAPAFPTERKRYTRGGRELAGWNPGGRSRSRIGRRRRHAELLAERHERVHHRRRHRPDRGRLPTQTSTMRR